MVTHRTLALLFVAAIAFFFGGCCSCRTTGPIRTPPVAASESRPSPAASPAPYGDDEDAAGPGDEGMDRLADDAAKATDWQVCMDAYRKGGNVALACFTGNSGGAK